MLEPVEEIRDYPVGRIYLQFDPVDKVIVWDYEIREGYDWLVTKDLRS